MWFCGTKLTSSLYMFVMLIKANDHFTSFGLTIPFYHDDNEHEKKGNKSWTGLKW